MTPKLNQIVRALHDSRAELLAQIEPLSQAQLDHRSDPARWSIGEVVHHIARIEGSVVALLGRGLAGADLPPDPTPEESVLGSLDRFRIEAGEPPVQAPPFALPERGLSQAALRAALDATREQLLDAMRRADGRDLSRLSYPHPLLGAFDYFQWLVFCVAHERRHTGQIRAARALSTPTPAAG